MYHSAKFLHLSSRQASFPPMLQEVPSLTSCSSSQSTSSSSKLILILRRTISWITSKNVSPIKLIILVLTYLEKKNIINITQL